MINGSVKSNGELRFLARQQLKGNWGMPILVCLVYSIIMGAPNAIPVLGSAAVILISGAMTLGLTRYFIMFKRNESPIIETLFDGFKLFIPSLVLWLLFSIFTFLWSLLLIVPGIIAALAYSQAFYILNDNPQIQAMDALRQSKQMMQGYKGKFFLLGLSFIGWSLLACLTLGIGFLWLVPYIQLSMANFYEDLKSSYNGNVQR